MSCSGMLQRLAIGLPVNLQVPLPDDDQHRDVHLPEQGSRIGRPELTGKGQVGWSFQTLQQHLDPFRQRRIRSNGLSGQETVDGCIVERKLRISIGYGSYLRSYLGARNRADGPSRRGG